MDPFALFPFPEDKAKVGQNFEIKRITLWCGWTLWRLGTHCFRRYFAIPKIKYITNLRRSCVSPTFPRSSRLVIFFFFCTEPNVWICPFFFFNYTTYSLSLWNSDIHIEVKYFQLISIELYFKILRENKERNLDLFSFPQC